MTTRSPSTTHLLRYFEHSHLPARLAQTSAPFRDLAHEMATRLPDGPELSAGLRKLLEAKDCMVRAALDTPRVEMRAKPVNGCEHCPDGHTPPDGGSQPWSAWLGAERDGDRQPTTIRVARAGGAHVAESDAEWVRRRLNSPAAEPR